ncbi:uncharacterized protein LOC124119672 [Haliotis rufescens]|uniref:uncharacterized protein LOC124119672 n=1 Tax=Haliotis rufescens TaxID=6454 RepID=UPI00201F6439|nr:uncharacterized protein LOC124119672 [Haliotis rufescens]
MGLLNWKHSSTYPTTPHRHRVAILDNSGSDVSKEKGTLIFKGQLYGTLGTGDIVAVNIPLSKTCPHKNAWHSNLKRYKQLHRVIESMCAEYKNEIFPISTCSSMVAPMKRATTWLMKTLGRDVREGEMVFIEEVFGKESVFVDSVGRSRKDCRALDELIHFSFHESRGERVLCGLRGAVGANGVFHLTEPTVHSVSRTYGDTDRGVDGINRVLKEHKCTDKCRNWRALPVDDVLERCVPTAPPLHESFPNPESSSPSHIFPPQSLSSTHSHPPPYDAVNDVIADLPPSYSELFPCGRQ